MKREIVKEVRLDYLDHAYELIKWRVDDLHGADHTGVKEERENLEKTLTLLNDLAVGNKWIILSKAITKINEIKNKEISICLQYSSS